MGVQITLLKRNRGVRRRWSGHSRDRPIEVLERPIRKRSQLSGGARRRETNVVLPKLKSAGQTLQRSIDRGSRRLDLVMVPREGKRHAAQQVKGNADDKIGPMGLDLDERIHHAIERQI